MKTTSTIAIDGPVASGKTSVGIELAKQLGFRFIDTGLMYRAVTWAALRDNIDTSNQTHLTQLSSSLIIELGPISDAGGDQLPHILVDGSDVTAELRSSNVEALVSAISSIKGVRTAMVEQQRKIAQHGKIVMVGRDITSVVLPTADLKIFLTASAENRAQRRYEENLGTKKSKPLNEILADLNRRDSLDIERTDSPLTLVSDSILIDTTDMTKEKVVKYIINLVRS